MSSSARTVILGSWARTWKRMRVGYVGTPETSFLDSILLVTVSWQSDRVRHAKFSQEYVTHFLSSSSFVSFLFFCQKSILVNNARVRRLRLDIEAGGLNVRKWFGEWCRVSATGSLRITERIIESIKPVKWETAASLTAHISFVIECLLAQRIIWVVWMEGGGGIERTTMAGAIAEERHGGKRSGVSKWLLFRCRQAMAKKAGVMLHVRAYQLLSFTSNVRPFR